MSIFRVRFLGVSVVLFTLVPFLFAQPVSIRGEFQGADHFVPLELATLFSRRHFPQVECVLAFYSFPFALCDREQNQVIGREKAVFRIVGKLPLLRGSTVLRNSAVQQDPDNHLWAFEPVPRFNEVPHQADCVAGRGDVVRDNLIGAVN
jgi:hypothetical protein